MRVPPGGSSLGSFLFTTSALAFGGPRSQIFNGWAPDALSGLDIDFTTGTLDPRITFARASTATYYNSSGLIASAASGAPRFDYDPATLTPRGLLLEEQRTNLLTYSNDFSNAAWVKAAGSSVVQDATGPDGVANSAWSATISPAGPGVFNYHAGANAGQPATQSIWLRAKSGTPQVYFEFGNGVGSTLLTLSTTWTRYTISDPVGHQYFELRTDAPTSLPSVTIEMYGAQLEVGTFVTSYIPTTSAAVTRAADTAEMTGANFSSWYNASAGTFVVEYRPQSVSGTQPVISVNDTTANEAIRLYGSGADPKAIVVDGGATQADLDAGAIAINTFYKLGLAFTLNDFAACLDGGTVATDATGTLPTVTQLQFHTDIAGNVANLHIKRLQYFNTRKTDSELQALTAAPAVGTGALTAQSAVAVSTTGVSGSLITDTTLNAGSAVVASTTGVSGSIAPNVALAAQAAAVASTTGLSRSIAPSVALAAQAATAVSTTGVTSSLITDTTINAGSAVIVSATGVSGAVITDTTITASSAAVASTTGVSRSIAPSVALAAQAAVAASTTGLSRSIATPVALAAQQSVISGLGGAGTTLVGTGVVTTRPALVVGAGLTASAGVGALQVSVATIDAHGVSAWIATAANLNAAWADIDGLGEIPVNTVVSGPYAQVGDLWEGAAVWGKVAGKWRRLRLWTKAADAWGVAAWDQATQEVDVWSLPAYGELEARGAHIAGSGFIRDQIWGAGDLVAGPALVTDSSSLSGLSTNTNAAWEPTPLWVKANGKWRRATMWTNVSEEWKRVA